MSVKERGSSIQAEDSREETVSLIDNSSSDVKRAPFIPDRKSDMYNRMKYYNTLTVNNPTHFNPPPHVLPPSLFPGLVYTENKGSQSSIVTIFSLWNSMMVRLF